MNSLKKETVNSLNFENVSENIWDLALDRSLTDMHDRSTQNSEIFPIIYLSLKNSLIIHEENTKEMNV